MNDNRKKQADTGLISLYDKDKTITVWNKYTVLYDVFVFYNNDKESDHIDNS